MCLPARIEHLVVVREHDLADSAGLAVRLLRELVEELREIRD